MPVLQPHDEPQRLRLGPGTLFTGSRAYACDGALLELVVTGTPEEPGVRDCRLLELHDLNIARRRNRFDVGAFLRRCLRRILAEGMILILDDGHQILWIPRSRIQHAGVRFRHVCAEMDEGIGPFF